MLLLLAGLIPFACQALTGTSGQGGDGSGVQGGTEESAPANGDGGGDEADGAQAGSQGDGESGAGEPTGSEDSQDVAAAQLNASDQGGNGETVTVPEATIEGTEGWLAIRADDNGEPGEVLGRAPLREGSDASVRVDLRRLLDSTQKLYATVHA